MAIIFSILMALGIISNNTTPSANNIGYNHSKDQTNQGSFRADGWDVDFTH